MKIPLSCLSDFLSGLGCGIFGGRASWVRIHGWGSPGEISVSVEGSVGDERHSRRGKSPRKDDSSESALLFQEEDILKVKKEKSPWSIRTDCVFAWLGVVVLGSFFPFFFSLAFFWWGTQSGVGKIRDSWIAASPEGVISWEGVSSCGSGCSTADAEQMRLEIGSRFRRMGMVMG